MAHDYEVKLLQFVAIKPKNKGQIKRGESDIFSSKKSKNQNKSKEKLKI